MVAEVPKASPEQRGYRTRGEENGGYHSTGLMPNLLKVTPQGTPRSHYERNIHGRVERRNLGLLSEEN